MASMFFRVGENIGDILLEIAQTNISEGNIKKGFNTYIDSIGCNKEHVLMLLKNKAVLVANEDGLGVTMKDNLDLIESNANNIFDWKNIIDTRLNELDEIRKAIIDNTKEFNKLYTGDIENYSIIDMMKRYYNDDEMKVMSSKANIAARIIGSFDGKICDEGYSNPTNIWEQMVDRIEYGLDNVAKWEKVLYFTVNHVNLIKMLHKAYPKFESTYLFLVENDFITRIPFIELTIENILSTLKSFADDTKGYYHPLCNTGLYEYKNQLFESIMHTVYGNEFLRNGIIKKNIMDGYDAGWLSPDGEFYGLCGETNDLLHGQIANQIYEGNNIYANRMNEDHVNPMGGFDSPDYWLESHGFMKIHNNEIYGSFIGKKTPTKDFPYPYCPSDIQIKMICDYADRFYNSMIYTQPQIVRSTEPIYTSKLKQMDEIRLHEIFGH